MSTENEKLLQQYFDEKEKLEEKKWKILDGEIRRLIKECDKYNNQLRELKKREIVSAEGKKLHDEIKTIKMKIQENVEKVTNLQKSVKEIENEIDGVIEKINEMVNGMRQAEFKEKI